MHYATGQTKPARHDREVALKSRQIYDEVRLSALKADGVAALAAHMMETIAELDAHRTRLSGDNPMLNQMLAEIEIDAYRKMQGNSRGGLNAWGL